LLACSAAFNEDNPVRLLDSREFLLLT